MLHFFPELVKRKEGKIECLMIRAVIVSTTGQAFNKLQNFILSTEIFWM